MKEGEGREERDSKMFYSKNLCPQEHFSRISGKSIVGGEGLLGILDIPAQLFEILTFAHFLGHSPAGMVNYLPTLKSRTETA